MKSSEALRKIKPLIAKGEFIHICTALQTIRDKKGEVLPPTLVEERIHRVTDGASIGAWLAGNSKEYRQFCQKQGHTIDSEYRLAMKEYRLAWIDWMIPQYKVIGD